MKKEKERIRPTILIVDDDEGMSATLESILRDDYNVLKAGDGEEALEILEEEDNVDIVFLDILLPGMDGLKVLLNIRRYHKDVDVIMGSVVKNPDHIVEAMKLGAYDYITKDFDYEEVRFRINRLVEHRRREREIVSLREKIKNQTENEFILGKSLLIQRVWEKVKDISKSDLPVFISGETGTGKHLLSREIHEQSDRKNNVFITVNLNLIPESSMDYILFGGEDTSLPELKNSQCTKIELSHQGTLCLNSIECLSKKAQPKLLAVIEKKRIGRIGSKKPIKVDFRLITTSNKTIEDLLKEGKLVKKLLAKIGTIRIEIPPLRERLEDISGLTRYFIKKYSSKLKKNLLDITPRALDLLSNYHWPGNVGELENLVQKLVITANDPIINEDYIPWEYRLFDRKNLGPGRKTKGFLYIARDAVERDLIYKALKRNNWSRKKTAEDLEIPYDTLKTKLRKFRLLKS